MDKLISDNFECTCDAISVEEGFSCPEDGEDPIDLYAPLAQKALRDLINDWVKQHKKEILKEALARKGKTNFPWPMGGEPGPKKDVDLGQDPGECRQSTQGISDEVKTAIEIMKKLDQQIHEWMARL